MGHRFWVPLQQLQLQMQMQTHAAALIDHEQRAALWFSNVPALLAAPAYMSFVFFLFQKKNFVLFRAWGFRFIAVFVKTAG